MDKIWDFYTLAAYRTVKGAEPDPSQIKCVHDMVGVLVIPDGKFYDGVFRVVQSIKKGSSAEPVGVRASPDYVVLPIYYGFGQLLVFRPTPRATPSY